MFPDLTRDDVMRLETSRLWLRWPLKSDCAQIARLAGDRIVAQRTAHIPHPYPPDAAGQFVAAAQASNRAGQSIILAITPKDRPDEAIGMVGIRSTGAAPVMGYWLGRPFWGQGLMTEAVRALTAMAFRLTAVERLESTIFQDNPASRRVLKKAGFALSGSVLQPMPVRGNVLPVDTFALSRQTWSHLDVENAPVTGAQVRAHELMMSMPPPVAGDAVWSGTALRA